MAAPGDRDRARRHAPGGARRWLGRPCGSRRCRPGSDYDATHSGDCAAHRVRRHFPAVL